MEEIKDNHCPICGRNSLSTSTEGKCIFHAKAEEKNENEFKKELGKLFKETNFNFDFSNFIFVGEVDFKKDYYISEFKGVSFNNVHFTSEASFVGAIFYGKAFFIDAHFTEEAFFDGVQFDKRAIFNGAHFTGRTSFISTHFTEGASFFDAHFTEEAFAYFNDAHFTKGASFAGAHFTKGASFAGADFTGRTSFAGASFSGDIFYNYAILENSDMSEIILSDNAQVCFQKTRLRNTLMRLKDIKNHISDENKHNYGEAKETYLLLKNNFHSIGRYEDES